MKTGLAFQKLVAQNAAACLAGHQHSNGDCSWKINTFNYHDTLEEAQLCSETISCSPVKYFLYFSFFFHLHYVSKLTVCCFILWRTISEHFLLKMIGQCDSCVCLSSVSASLSFSSSSVYRVWHRCNGVNCSSDQSLTCCLLLLMWTVTLSPSFLSHFPQVSLCFGFPDHYADAAL